MPLFAAISDVVNCFDLEAIRFASLTTSSMRAAVSLQSPARVRGFCERQEVGISGLIRFSIELGNFA